MPLSEPVHLAAPARCIGHRVRTRNRAESQLRGLALRLGARARGDSRRAIQVLRASMRLDPFHGPLLLFYLGVAHFMLEE